jgi:hypothetical protein
MLLRFAMYLRAGFSYEGDEPSGSTTGRYFFNRTVVSLPGITACQ